MLTDDLQDTLKVFEASADLGEPLTATEVAERLNVSKRRGAARLDGLVDQGFLRTKTVGTGDRVWWPPPERAAETERSLSTLVENVPGMIYRCRNETGWPMEFVSDGSRQLTGYEPEALETGRINYGDDVIHPDDVDHVWATVQEELAREGRFTIQYRIRTADDETRWVWERGRAVAEGSDEPPTLEGLITDITELKTQARHLKREIDDVFERVDDAFYALDTDFRFTYVNEHAEELLQRTEEQLLGESVWEVFPAATETPAWERFHEALETLEPTSFEVYFEPLAFWVQANVYPSETGLSVYFRDITERKERERELKRQREHLAALEDFNQAVRKITDTVIEESTRKEIEEAVCEQLAVSESYKFAWIAELDPTTESIQQRTEAGVDGYLENIEFSTRPDQPIGEGPAGKTFRTGEMTVCRDVFEDPACEPWRDAAEKYGFRSFTAIPIVHKDALYGVLGVYSERVGAFAEDERKIIGQLGEVIGHALNAHERKQALMSNQGVKVEFLAHNVLDEFGVTEPDKGKITFDQTIPLGDEEFLVYGTTTGDAFEALESLADQLPHFREPSLITEAPDEIRYQVRLIEPPVFSTVAAHGGRIRMATIEDGDYRLIVEVPPDVGIRRIADVVRDTYPAAEVLAQRQIAQRDQTPERIRQVLTDDLTDRQRTVLESAYYAGFFEWPRTSTGEEVGESMGIAPATFSQHLRAGQNKLLGALFAEEPTQG